MTTQTIDRLVISPNETAAQDFEQPEHQSGTGALNGAATASQQNRVRYVPAETGATYWGPGDQVTFLITGAETGGAFSLVEGSCPPGGGPPPHIHHREDESFYVLEGTLTIQVGGDTITASAGDFAFLPRGIVHSFKNNGDVTAKALVLITPGGFENFFAEAFYPAVDRSSPPPPPSKELIARLLAAAPRYGLEFIPPA
jgi:quercetin dioxygenase-like cupin family protein